MIFFMHDTGKVNSLLLLLFLPGAVLFSMDVKRTVSAGPYKNSSRNSQKSIIVFDPQKAVEVASEWEDIVPQSVMITPDDKGVLLCSRGKVSYAPFDALCGMAAKPIIEHAHKHCPMIITTQKEGSLLVVSAMNYKDLETAKPVSEYIEYWNGTSKIPKRLPWPIQALTFFNKSPKTIVMASRVMESHAKISRSFIVVMDLDTGSELYRHHFTRHDWIVDIAMNEDDTMMIVAGSFGSIQLIKVEIKEVEKKERKIDLSHLNWVTTEDHIKEVSYPIMNKLLYSTGKGEIKISKIRRVIEPKTTTNFTDSHKQNYTNLDEQETSSCEKVGKGIFSYSENYDSVSIDSSGRIASVHWSRNSNAHTTVRHYVKIYRQFGKSIEKFILKLSPAEEKCAYIKNGRLGVRDWTVVTAAIRNNRVVVLGDDGKLRIHTLPHIGEIQENDQQVIEMSPPFRRDTVKIQKTQRRRSLTYSGGDIPPLEDESPICTVRLAKLGQLPEQCAVERDKEKKEKRGSVSPSPRIKGGKDKLHQSEPSIPVSVTSEQSSGDSLQRGDSSKKKSPRSPKSYLKLSFESQSVLK